MTEDEKNKLYQDTDIRVIDQRIGMGIGGWNTVVRLYHKPTGILIEMPQVLRNQFLDKKLAFEMLEYAISEIGDK
jgi:protein subunit release factor A